MKTDKEVIEEFENLYVEKNIQYNNSNSNNCVVLIR
jgi:hypothetical protein